MKSNWTKILVHNLSHNRNSNGAPKSLARLLPNLIFAALFFVMAPSFAAISEKNVQSKNYQPANFQDIKLGLTLSPAKTGWIFLNENDYASQGMRFVARPLGNRTISSLSLRIDKSPIDSIKKYSEKWLKDYPKFGFELQLAQDAIYGDLKGYEIELVSKKQSGEEKRIHQFITKNDGNFWIFTCSGESAIFDQALKSCQDILKTSKLITQPNLILSK